MPVTRHGKHPCRVVVRFLRMLPDTGRRSRAWSSPGIRWLLVRRSAVDLLCSHGLTRSGPRRLRISRVPARRGGSRRPELISGSAVLRLLFNICVGNAWLSLCGQSRPSLGAHRGQYLGERCARRTRGEDALTRSRVEVRDHQLVRRHDRPARDAVALLCRQRTASDL